MYSLKLRSEVAPFHLYLHPPIIGSIDVVYPDIKLCKHMATNFCFGLPHVLRLVSKDGECKREQAHQPIGPLTLSCIQVHLLSLPLLSALSYPHPLLHTSVAVEVLNRVLSDGLPDTFMPSPLPFSTKDGYEIQVLCSVQVCV